MLVATQHIGLAARGATGPTSLSQVDSATSTTQNIAIPATVQAGDLLVLYSVRTYIVSDPGAFTPTGFTTIHSVHAGTAQVRSFVGARLATASDAGANIDTGSTDGTWLNHLYVFRGDDPINAFAVFDAEVSGPTAANPAGVTTNASTGTPPLVVIGTYSSNNAVDPRTFSTTKDGEITAGGGSTSWLAYKIYNAAPADTTIDMDDEGDVNTVTGSFIQVS